MKIVNKLSEIIFDFDHQKKKCIAAMSSNDKQKTKKILGRMVQKYLSEYERPLDQKQNNLQSKLQAKLQNFFNCVLIEAIKSDNFELLQLFYDVGYDPNKAKLKSRETEMSCLDLAFLRGKVGSVKILYNFSCPRRAHNWQKNYENLALKLGYPILDYSQIHRVARGLSVQEFLREQERRKLLVNKSKTF